MSSMDLDRRGGMALGLLVLAGAWLAPSPRGSGRDAVPGRKEIFPAHAQIGEASDSPEDFR